MLVIGILSLIFYVAESRRKLDILRAKSERVFLNCSTSTMSGTIIDLSGKSNINKDLLRLVEYYPTQTTIYLDLSNSNVGDAEIEVLQNSTKVDVINLKGSRVSAGKINELRKLMDIHN